MDSNSRSCLKVLMYAFEGLVVLIENFPIALTENNLDGLKSKMREVFKVKN